MSDVPSLPPSSLLTPSAFLRPTQRIADFALTFLAILGSAALLVVLAVFFWGPAFSGILGILLAIPLTAFFVTGWRLARFEYLATPSQRKVL
jgi:predicted PurR-regulated permease PerM